jgi:hypothetical protein
VVDKGASTYIMSLSCWKYFYSSNTVTSISLLKRLDGWSFKPHIIIPTISVELGAKNISIKVLMVDAPLDYNLLLGWRWMYEILSFIY